jgi:antitoxin VapB
MSLNIKNPQAEALARRLVQATGESMTRAVTVALEERLARVEQRAAAEEESRVARITDIARDAGARWVEPYRSTPHGELLYDEHGLPR